MYGRREEMIGNCGFRSGTMSQKQPKSDRTTKLNTNKLYKIYTVYLSKLKKYHDLNK